jgi:hypothetical protein
VVLSDDEPPVQVGVKEVDQVGVSGRLQRLDLMLKSADNLREVGRTGCGRDRKLFESAEAVNIIQLRQLI